MQGKNNEREFKELLNRIHREYMEREKGSDKKDEFLTDFFLLGNENHRINR